MADGVDFIARMAIEAFSQLYCNKKEGGRQRFLYPFVSPFFM